MTGETGRVTDYSVNACKLCTPLGACIALRGIKNSMPLIHGSQGCSTYIRRYVISHFREPMDIASSSFSEETTIFGGENNLIKAVENVNAKYKPELIGVVTSCLSETIGENIPMYLHKLTETSGGLKFSIIHVSTPAYSGTHVDGFHKTVRAAIEQLSEKNGDSKSVNLLPGFVTPADIRHLKEILADFNLQPIVLPDYSETLDAPVLDEYRIIPEGGTSVGQIKSMGDSEATIEFGKAVPDEQSGGLYLEKKFGVKRLSLGFPIGVRAADYFFKELESLSGVRTQEKYVLERGRLIDSYVDAHKYLFAKKAVIYGEEDLVASIAEFLLEIGVIPVLVASGGSSGRLAKMIYDIAGDYRDRIIVRDGVDFEEIGEIAGSLKPDIIIGNSKGYKISRKLGVPLVRLGFPIHDRIGAQRILTLGYRGTQNLFDLITNTLLEVKQEKSSIGYSYI
jgi:nitrogenase molybdenum-iron protein NifN